MFLKKLNLNFNREGIRDLLHNLDLEQERETVNRESRARVVILGRPGVGKSTLFNQLRGWAVSPAGNAPADLPNPDDGELVEDYGLFCLVDLVDDGPVTNGFAMPNGHGPASPVGELRWQPPAPEELPLPLDFMDPLLLAEGADLLVYVLDGETGVQPTDYRWIGRLRRLGIPLVVALNKRDLLGDALPEVKATVENRLGTGVLPISALTGAAVNTHLLPKMTALCPNLLVALGREVGDFRRRAARRVIHQAALLNGLVSLEPVLLIDLPLQILTLTGMMFRIATLYDQPPGSVRRREVAVAIGGGLLGRIAAQQLAKLVPVVGWLVSAGIAWLTTWALGQAAISYFEAGGDDAVDRTWLQTRTGVSNTTADVYRRWQNRPRLQVSWQRPDVAQAGEGES